MPWHPAIETAPPHPHPHPPPRAPGPPVAARPAPWTPLLASGRDAARAWAAIDAIARGLAAPPAAPATIGLEAGLAGHALFAAYRARALTAAGDPVAAQAAAAADAQLDELVARAGSARIGPSLFAGLAGIAWVLEHVSADPQDGVDAALGAWAARRAHEPDCEYDLIGGLAGVGVRALEGVPRPAAVDCLHLAVDALCARAEHLGDGARWWSPPSAASRARFPRGHENLGPAHGQLGALVLLARALAAGVLGRATADRARATLVAGVRRLLGHALPDPDARYPGWCEPGAAPEPARLAWCYGDAGMAAALLVVADAAAAAGLPEAAAWRAEAARTAAAAAAREPATAGVQDAGLCHGSAGLALLFARLHHGLGGAALAAAARYWLADTLDRLDPAAPLAGARAWNGEALALDPSWLTGAAGIGLALLAAVSPVAPAWDRLLGVSA